MSFAQDVKRELAAIVPADEHCRRAQLAGLLFGAGHVRDRVSGGHVAVRGRSRLPAVARQLLALLRPYGVTPPSCAPSRRRRRLALRGRPGRRSARPAAAERDRGADGLASASADGAAPARRARHCCLVAFLRGMFLGCGSISPPGAPVHAEFTLANDGAGRRPGGVAGPARSRPSVSPAGAQRRLLHQARRDGGRPAGRAGRPRRPPALGGAPRPRPGARAAPTGWPTATRPTRGGRRRRRAGRPRPPAASWPAAAGRPFRRPCVRSPSCGSVPLLEPAGAGARARPPLSKSALNHRMRRLLALDAGAQPARRAGAPAPTFGHLSRDGISGTAGRAAVWRSA